MTEQVIAFLVYRMNYFAFIILMMMGLYGIFAKTNYMKKIIGLNILQTAIILFFISTSAKMGATIPVLKSNNGHPAVHAADYMNPLPHVLMLTAIVVAVATLGVALAITIKIYKDYSTIEEDKIIAKIRAQSDTRPENHPGPASGAARPADQEGAL